MRQEEEIGKFFKGKFENYAETPPKRVWENIASYLGHPKPVKNIFHQRFFIITITLVGIATLLSIVFLTRKSNQTLQNDFVQNTTTISTSTENKITQQAQTFAFDSSNNKPDRKNEIPASIHSSALLTSKPFPSQESSIVINENRNIPVKAISEAIEAQPELPIQPEITEPLEIEPAMDFAESLQIQSIETEILNYQVISVCKGEEVFLNAGDGQNYKWNNGAQTQAITFQALENSLFDVNFVNPDGKKVKQTFDIRLLNCSIYIPKAFSPNNDGFNDIYKVEAEGLAEFEMKIFSQWGELVFQSKDIHSGWDGRIHGSRAPSGIYIYQIRYTDPISHKRAFFGTLTLLP